jgi:hypothetical protein
VEGRRVEDSDLERRRRGGEGGGLEAKGCQCEREMSQT